ncbi:MAG: 30S ribosomal protein S4 [Endomicrobia bacterium]|nr:30S ribosomal protein S4 [Endomicrobiia bacterium]
MGRYILADCRLCRREGQKLVLKGEKCTTQKCPIEKGKKSAPGQHGKKPVKISEYGRRLREKQKLKRMAGINEEQLRRYFELAQSQKGLVGENLLRIIERRLDNVVYKIGWAQSRDNARQMVVHKHIKVNGRNLWSPSYVVNIGDKIELNEKMKNNIYIQKSIENNSFRTPSWIKYDKETFSAEIIALPSKEEFSFPINETFIVEFYSK